ncbi:hypothetical protein BOTBODRAFT_240420 [Botryobasidium botryosum FD-172 SS1]|uniref:Uncharacterized protein n=1 Tax=Botryobasidium botryosum (strain FD-172 SS1) TaxID=930990 RepID=A0A067MM21_BOTB1|nr:hypothetical protein BOTBODRAFT_240420 [Botryobasidium botryosum FD-172 SS1]
MVDHHELTPTRPTTPNSKHRVMDGADAARIIDDDLDGTLVRGSWCVPFVDISSDRNQLHTYQRLYLQAQFTSSTAVPSIRCRHPKVFTTYIAPYRVHLGNNNTFLFIDGDSYGIQPTPHLIDLVYMLFCSLSVLC